MGSLERHRGHFYNWYDTQTRLPLAPAVCLHGRQRQPRRTSADPAAGPRSVVRCPTAQPSLAGGHSRHVRAARRRCGYSAPAGGARSIRRSVAERPKRAERRAGGRLDSGGATAPSARPRWQRSRRQPDDRRARRGRDLGASACAAMRGSPAMSCRAPGAVRWQLTNRRRHRHCVIAAERRHARRFARSPTLRRRQPRSRGATGRRSRRLAVQAAALAEMDYGFLFDQVRRQLVIGYNVTERRRDASLLRSAGVGSAPGQLRRHRAGKAAAGKLVRAGTSAHLRRRRAGAAGMERLDVRVPDAAAGDAHVRKHAARSDLRRGRGAADRVWKRARRALGHIGERLQQRRRRISTINIAPSAFPGLGLKRGLGDDLVVAPYASALALMVAPGRRASTCSVWPRTAWPGGFGLFEAIDYTPSRQRRGETSDDRPLVSWRITRE